MASEEYFDDPDGEMEMDISEDEGPASPPPIPPFALFAPAPLPLPPAAPAPPPFSTPAQPPPPPPPPKWVGFGRPELPVPEAVGRELRDRIQRVLGYRFGDAQLLWDALVIPPRSEGATRSAFTSQALPKQGNLRLAHLGDKEIARVLAVDTNHLDYSIAESSDACDMILQNINMELLMVEKGLDLDCPNKLSGKAVADRFEAFIGAMTLDGGSADDIRRAMWNIGMYHRKQSSLPVVHGNRPRAAKLKSRPSKAAPDKRVWYLSITATEQ